MLYRMKLSIFIITLTLFVAICNAKGTEHWGGEVMLLSGEMHKADSFNIYSETSALKFRLVNEEKVRSVNWKDIDRLEIIDFKETSRYFKGGITSSGTRKYGYLGQGTVAKLTLQNRNSSDVILENNSQCNAVFCSSVLKLTYVDEFTGEQNTSSIKWENIRAVSFNGNIGRLKFDIQTSTYFPSSYNFNPYSGNKLVWRSPGLDGKN